MMALRDCAPLPETVVIEQYGPSRIWFLGTYGEAWGMVWYRPGTSTIDGRRSRFYLNGQRVSLAVFQQTTGMA